MQDLDVCISIVNNVLNYMRIQKTLNDDVIKNIYSNDYGRYQLILTTQKSFVIWSNYKYVLCVKYDYEDLYPFIVTVAKNTYFENIEPCVDFIMSMLPINEDDTNKRQKSETSAPIKPMVVLRQNIKNLLEGIKYRQYIENTLSTIKRTTNI